MRIVAFYVLSCCIATSWQRDPHQYWNRPEFNYPQFLDPYFPHSFYMQGQAHQPYYQQNPSYHHYFYPSLAAQLGSPITEQSSQDDSNKKEAQEETTNGDETKEATFRTFIPKYLLAAQIYNTYTKYSITTTTVTSTSFLSCIPAASFFGGSTLGCRRRRDYPLELRSASDDDNADGSLVNPTPVAGIEATSAMMPSTFNDFEPNEKSLEELESSLLSKDPDNKARSLFGWYLANRVGGRFGNYRYGYGYNGLIFGSTVTSTITSFSFSTTVSRRSITTIGSNLSCLPNGYSIC